MAAVVDGGGGGSVVVPVAGGCAVDSESAIAGAVVQALAIKSTAVDEAKRLFTRAAPQKQEAARSSCVARRRIVP